MTAIPPATPSRLTIQLLGSFRVTVGDRVVDDRAWRLKRATQLVKLLALAPGHRLHRDQLIDQLWPDADGDWAAASFHQALHAARNALEPRRPARSANSLLSLQRQVLILAPETDCWIDSEAFVEAAAGARASDDVSDSLAALALYAGDLLPEDLYESWTAADREQLRQIYLSLLFTTAQRQAAAGLAADAIGTLQTLIGEDSLNEAAYVALMRLEARSGQRDRAARHYQQLREMLETELATEPSPEATELYRRIIAGEFTTPLIVPGPMAPATTRPARPAAPAPSAPESLVDRARADGLIAREAELTSLPTAFDAMLAGKGQIVLLAGEPGIGKTRLAEVLADYAMSRGTTALWAYGHEAPDVPAFWFWAQLVRASLRERPIDEARADLGVEAGPIAQVVPELFQLLPDLPEPVTLDPAQARYRFFDSMTAYLEQLSRRTPLVLLLDDLQWADRASIALLEFMADLIADQRILVLLTYRAAEAQGNQQLLQTIERLRRSRSAQRLDLSGFAPEETARFGELVGGRSLPAEVRASVYARTDGNPLFVRELVRLFVAGSGDTVESDLPSGPGRWGSTVPAGIREAVGMRLRLLADETRRLLSIAAVIGSTFALDVLTATADVS